MALTITYMDNGVSGHKRSTRGTLALDAGYPSGGYPVTARTFGLGVIDPGGLVFGQKLGYLLDYNAATLKVQVYQPNDMALVGGQAPGDAVQISASNVLGKTSVGDVVAVSSAPVEVPAGTDLSSLTGVAWQGEGV